MGVSCVRLRQLFQFCQIKLDNFYSIIYVVFRRNSRKVVSSIKLGYLMLIVITSSQLTCHLFVYLKEAVLMFPEFILLSCVI
jgi:hypothetical protein